MEYDIYLIILLIKLCLRHFKYPKQIRNDIKLLVLHPKIYPVHFQTLIDLYFTLIMHLLG